MRTTPDSSALALFRCVVCHLSAVLRWNANFLLHFCVDSCVVLHPTTSAYFLVCLVVLLGVALLGRDYQFLDNLCLGCVGFFVLALAEVLPTFLHPASRLVCVVCDVS